MYPDVGLPNMWDAVLLGDVADIILGGTPSTEVDSFWGGDIPWMASGEVNKRHICEVDGRITESGLTASNATLVEPPSVAVGLAGQGKTRGTVAMVHIRVSTNQSIALIKGKQGKLDTGFLFHNLGNRYEELRSRSAGGGRAGLSREILQLVPLLLPKPEEQYHIAAVLDIMDEAIAKTEAVIAKIKQVRAGLFRDLLTYGLDEHGRLRDPITHPEQFKDSPIGQVPSGWKVCTLSDALQTPPRNGFSPREAPVFHGSYLLGLGCLTPEGFEPNQLKSAPEDTSALAPFRLRDGDLLISRSNTRELVALPGVFREVGYPCYYPDLMMRLIPKNELLPDFLEIILRHSSARSRLISSACGTSGSMVKITGAGVMGTLVAYPLAAERNEQWEILRMKSAIDGELASSRSEYKKLVSIRSGLMADLLTGRVRVPEGVGVLL